MKKAIPVAPGPGATLSAGEWNRLWRELERLNQFSAQYPLELVNQAGGPSLRLLETEFFAVVQSAGSSSTSSSTCHGTPYGWSEIEWIDNKSNWQVKAGGRSGTVSLNPAFEANGVCVSLPFITWLRPGFGGEYVFDHCCGSVSLGSSSSSSSSASVSGSASSASTPSATSRASSGGSEGPGSGSSPPSSAGSGPASDQGSGSSPASGQSGSSPTSGDSGGSATSQGSGASGSQPSTGSNSGSGGLTITVVTDVSCYDGTLQVTTCRITLPPGSVVDCGGSS